MAGSRILQIVATECPPQDDEKFNKWYNDVHVPMLMKYRGIKKVTRYRLVGEGQFKYLALYEFDSPADIERMPKSPEFAAAMEEMQGTWKNGIDLKWAAVYEPIKTWER